MIGFKGLLLLPLFLAGCAMDVGVSEHRIEFNEKDTEQNLLARVGDTIEIALPSNATTGYVWKLASPDEGPVRKSTEEHYDVAAYDNGEGGKVGVGGKTVFEFRAVTEGKKVLEFDYIRSWEKGIPPVKHVTVLADVQ